MIAKIRNFILKDLWKIRGNRLSRKKGTLLHCFKILVLSVHHFQRDRCTLRASALTFYSLLSIVPVLAMAFGVAKGFGLDQRLSREILGQLHGQETVMRQMIEFAYSMLESTSGGIVAGVGMIFLFWTIVQMLGNIETSFNDIWGIQKSRSLGKKFTDYLSLMLIVPVLLIVAGSINLFLVNRVAGPSDAISGVLNPLIIALLTLSPYILISALLSFLYIYLPNTEVRIMPGIWGGFITGLVYQIVQWGYIQFQIHLANFGAIYGSFAALPLFLIWLQISWLVVLFGAEISFACQNVETYESEQEPLEVSPALKKILALRMVKFCLERFVNSSPAPASDEIAQTLDIPAKLANMILYDLTRAKILVAARQDDKSDTYLPARPPENIRMASVLQGLDHLGGEDLPAAVHQSEEVVAWSRQLEMLEREIENSQANIPLTDLSAIKNR